MIDREEMLDLVHETMLEIQAAKKPGCKLNEIAEAVEEIDSKQSAKHYADLLVKDGRAVRAPGAGGLRALTEEEQDTLAEATTRKVAEALFDA